jgi:cellulose synthase/poly-beta-1,6-N-acetylglucosamine synthase-like glycosyltransferase
MTSPPPVSVVVPAYNAERTIDECVRSLLALRYPASRLQLVMVDNDSRDGTARALARYGDRIAVVRETRRGPGAARNAGLRVAEGALVAFTDSDCVVDRDWLARLLSPLADPQVGVAGGAILALPPTGEIERYGETIHDHRKAIEVFDPPYAITMSWASRREVLYELGGFDPWFRRGEDVDLSYRVVQAGYRLAFVPDAVVYHRNERTLAGLFREGCAHGFYGVRTRRRHARFLHELGHGRSRAAPWTRAAGARSRCEAAFLAGKAAGDLVGTLRFARLGG